MAERTLENPLHEDDYQRLKNALNDTVRIEAALNRHKLTGADVTEAIKQNRDMRARIQTLLNVYFPGR